MDIEFMATIFPRLLRATAITIQASVVSLILGLCAGIVLGVLRVYGNRITKLLIKFWVTIVRGTPAAIQIYAAFFLLPRIGIQLPAFWVGVIALSFNTSGYQVEIVRSALESIDRGQIEAGASIGLTKWKTMLYITLPQSLRRMMGPMTNEFANLIKISSALMLIAVYELTRAGHAIISATYKYAEVLILVALIYFAIVQSMSKLSSYLENNVFNFGQNIKTNNSFLD